LIAHHIILFSIYSFTYADVAEGLNSYQDCKNDYDCFGKNRKCYFTTLDSLNHQTRFVGSGRPGSCVCKAGYVEKDSRLSSLSDCVKKKGGVQQCDSDYDCGEDQVCVVFRSDRLMLNGLEGLISNRKICIGTWMLYLADLEEPRTGGGLRSRFHPDDIFFKRGKQVTHQYDGFVEDKTLVLFLIVMLVILVSVFKANCYRQFQDARRNTPLRHLLPIAEDQPPPYPEPRDSADGLAEVATDENLPKRQSETPPPTYHEALNRNAMQSTDPESNILICSLDVSSEDGIPPAYNEVLSVGLVEPPPVVVDETTETERREEPTDPVDQTPPEEIHEEERKTAQEDSDPATEEKHCAEEESPPLSSPTLHKQSSPTPLHQTQILIT